jgi:hypothetical protein
LWGAGWPIRASWATVNELIARGRDAADVALSTSFGPRQLAKFEVVTEEQP